MSFKTSLNALFLRNIPPKGVISLSGSGKLSGKCSLDLRMIAVTIADDKIQIIRIHPYLLS